MLDHEGATSMLEHEGATSILEHKGATFMGICSFSLWPLKKDHAFLLQVLIGTLNQNSRIY